MATKILAPWARLALIAEALDLLTACDDPAAQDAATDLRSYLAEIAPDAKVGAPVKGATGVYRWEPWAKAVMERWRRGLSPTATPKQVADQLKRWNDRLQAECDKALKTLPGVTWSEKLQKGLEWGLDRAIMMGAALPPKAALAAIAKARELLKTAALGTEEGLAALKGKLKIGAKTAASEAAEVAKAPAAADAGKAGAGLAVAAAAAGAAAGAAGAGAGTALAEHITADTPGGGAGVALGGAVLLIGTLWALNRKKTSK